MVKKGGEMVKDIKKDFVSPSATYPKSRELFLVAHNSYPEKEISNLYKSAKSSGEILTLVKGQSLLVSKEEVIYFLISGTVEMTRENVIQNIISRPFPIGVLERYKAGNFYSYKVRSSGVFLVVKWRSWDRLIKENSLNEDVFVILSYCFSLLSSYYFSVSFGDAYNSIRELIYMYDVKRDAILKGNESLLKYIISRVSISRSQVMKILSELKKGGYITIRNGYLTSINKKLPDDF